MLEEIWALTATEGKKKRKKERNDKRKEGRRMEGERVGGREGIGLISSQQELRVSRITIFRAKSGRCAHTHTHTHTHTQLNCVTQR
jgi:hypothetical protein